MARTILIFALLSGTTSATSAEPFQFENFETKEDSEITFVDFVQPKNIGHVLSACPREAFGGSKPLKDRMAAIKARLYSVGPEFIHCES